MNNALIDIEMNMEKTKQYILSLCFLLTAVSVIFTLIDIKTARVTFYIACYLSIIGIILDRKNYASFVKNIPMALFLVGLSKVIWFCLFYIGNPDMDIYNSYLQSGKRVVLGAVLIAYLLVKVNMIQHKMMILGSALALSFCVSTIFAVIQVAYGLERVSLNTNATDAAYMYSCLSLCLIVYLFNLHAKTLNKYLLIFMIFLISLCVIVYTGTRSAIVIHPALFLGLLFIHSHKSKKIIGIISLLFLLGLGVVFNNAIINKVNQTKNEISIYKSSNGNQGSSLGSRFSMWNTGLEAFYVHPMGMSMEQRYATIKEYIEIKQEDFSALEYAKIHLHNEVIDTLSLQGIFGVLVLLYFYLAMLKRAIGNNNHMLLITTLCIFAYGLTDVIFISREQTIFFSLMILFSLLFAEVRQESKTIA